MSKTRYKHQADDQSSLLLPPEEVRSQELYPKFSLKTLGAFAQTSQKAELETAFLRLLPSVVDAEPESYKPESYKPGDETKLAAIAILQRHLQNDPELLFRKGLVTDHYGRKLWGSAIRLFWGTGDIWALKQIYESIIPHIEEGEAKAQAQFKEQFPNCSWPFNPDLGEEQLYDDRNKKQVAQVIAQLQVIDAKITADPCKNGLTKLEETKKAVEALRQIYLPKEDEVIRTGLHFPLAIQRKIHELYDTRLRGRLDYQPNAWSWDQLAFFSREVIGSMQDALTSVDGQCVKVGLVNVDMKKGPDRRDGLFCRQPKGIPAELAPLHGKLGRTVFVDPYDGCSCFLTSVAGSFDWYNKKGWCKRWANRAGLWDGKGCVGFARSVHVENFWRTKAETYRSYDAATKREINTPS